MKLFGIAILGTLIGLALWALFGLAVLAIVGAPS